MSSRLQQILWFLLFTIIFLLSLDYWTWDSPLQFTLFNFPQWLHYFIVLQLIFAAAIILFIKYYWTHNNPR